MWISNLQMRILPKSQGLKNISQRIYALNGQVKIDTMPNKGTTLSLKIPL